jgi:hypothetical protein
MAGVVGFRGGSSSATLSGYAFQRHARSNGYCGRSSWLAMKGQILNLSGNWMANKYVDQSNGALIREIK